MNSSTGNTNLTLKAKQALDLVSGKKNVVQAQRGEHYRVVGKNATGEEQLQDNVIARKKGSDLVLRYADGTELQLENYYIECKAGDCDITLPSGTVEGFLVSAETSMGAALADGSTLSYAYGNPSTLMQMAQTDASLTAALTGLQGTMVTYHPVDVPVAAAASSSGFGLWTALGALGVVAGAARWEAGHSDTAAATATPDNLVQGQLTAGPTVSGHGLGVDVFQADGKTLLGHVKINPDGSFTVNVGAYTGVIIAKITDENTNNDYMDEASGEAKDLDDDVVLMAVANVSSGITVININPITTIAALKAGMTSNGELGNSATLLSKEQVTGANAVVASALGLDNILITKPVTTVIADGTANPDFDTAEMSAGETYGALLASLSGVDQTHGTAATIQLVEAGIVTSGNLGVVDSATKTVLEQGATTAAGGIGHALAAVVKSAIDSSSVTELTTESNIVNALLAIRDASDNNNSAQTGVTAATFSTAGITGVDDNNIAAIQSALNSTAVTSDQVSNTSKIQALVDAYSAILSGADDDAINNNANATAAQYTMLGVTGIAASNITLVNDVVDGLDGSKIDTIGELQALSDATNAVISGANGGTAPTLEQLVALGIQDVNASNLSAVQKAIADSGNSGTGIDSLAELQALVTSVPPTITSGAVATALNENSGAGQAVYTATADDSSAGVTFTLGGTDAALLSINASSGVVSLKADPDFENKESYSFTVSASDAAGNSSSSKSVSLAINDLDELAPTITSGAVATALNENSGAGQAVYTAQSTDTGDVAVGATVYTLALGSDAGLSINSSSGAVTLTGSPD
nr:cadherin repeat domain-containing protein [Rhodoferax sp.]